MYLNNVVETSTVLICTKCSSHYLSTMPSVCIFIFLLLVNCFIFKFGAEDYPHFESELSNISKASAYVHSLTFVLHFALHTISQVVLFELIFCFCWFLTDFKMSLVERCVLFPSYLMQTFTVVIHNGGFCYSHI